MRVAIIGRTEILYDTVHRLREVGHDITCLVTAKEAPEYTKTAADFQRLAVDLGVPFACTSKIETQIGVLRDSASDVAVSANYTGLIPSEITDLFPLGILNAHGGDLPRYRGNACQAWAILNGESRIGLCIHRMVGGELDSGDIIARDYFPIDLSTTVTAAWGWLNQRVPTLFLEAIERLASDPAYILQTQSKEPGDVLRCYPRRPDDGRIDWKQPAADILRLINASNKPYSGAFGFLEGEKFTIWSAELVSDCEIFCAVPGQVTRVGPGFIEVACGSEKLRLISAEVAGEVAAPSDWVRSIRKRLT